MRSEFLLLASRYEKDGGGEKAGFVELLFATTALFDQLHTGRFSTKPTRYVS